jgi:hypothetical protein
MKNTLLFTILLLLSGCVYEQPSLLTLSGTYVISDITISSETDTLNINLGVNDTLVNNSGGIWNPLGPNDTIFLGQTRWGFDYSKFYMYKPDSVISVYYQTYQSDLTPYDLGYLYFDYNGYKSFKIVEDGTESLSLGVSSLSSGGDRLDITLGLTRVGP